MPSFQVTHIRELYPMFWAKSCELAGMIAPAPALQQEKAGTLSEAFEVEFGHWSVRATLDIIGYLSPEFFCLLSPRPSD